MWKKILLGLLIFVVVLVGALATLPFIFKDKLIAIAREQVNDRLTAKVDWSDLGVSAFKDFPNISVYMKDLVVVTDTPFKGDTLAYVKELIVSVNPQKLLSGKHIDINGIIIKQPYVYVRVDKDGNANYNIMKPDTSTAPVDTSKGPGYSIGLRKFVLKDAYIIYDDKEDGLYAELDKFTNKLSGKFDSNNFELTDNGTADAITFKQGKIAYLSKVKTKLNIAIDVDQAKGQYTFKKNSITLNDLTLGVNGDLVMKSVKNITANLTLNAKEPDFKHLISLIPAVYSNEFKKVKTSGALALDGYVKGTYNGVKYPAFGVTLKVANGSFQYPDLPESVTGINIDASAKNPGGSLDNTVIDVSKVSATLGKDPFSAKMHVVNPVLDPEIDASLNGKIDLASVKNYYPMKGDELTGHVSMDVKAKGKLSAVEKQQYQDFDAQGTIEVTDLIYKTKDLPRAAQLNRLKLTFKPELVSLDAFSAQLGKSDISATGELDNLLNYLFSKATLKGNLKLISNVLDLNEFLAADATTTPAITPEKADKKEATPKKTETKPAANAAPKAAPKPTPTAAQVPKKIDFTLDAYANKIYYTNIVLDSVAGEVVIRNETVSLNNLQGRAFEGNILLNGDYTTLGSEVPRVDMHMKLDMISVEKAVIGFEKMLASIPVVKSARGVLTTVLNVKTELDREMSPKLKTMVADGRIDIHHLEFKPNKTTTTLAERTKMNELKMIKAKDFFTTIKVAKGNLYVEPFNLPLGKINITIYGSHDLSDSTSADYNMMMDAPDSTGKGKHKKIKVGMHGKGADPTIHQATDEGDTAIQNADAEQQKLVNDASAAKASSETKFDTEKEKRKQAAEARAQKKADKLKQQAEQKARDQGGSPQ